MPERSNRIKQLLDSLCMLTRSDFAALAVIGSDQKRLRWAYAAGARSDRYRQMLLKQGAGAAGIALRTGKPFLWSGVAAEAAYCLPCPLTAAELLGSAAAFPYWNGTRVEGVLLLGRRTSEPYANSSEFECVPDRLRELFVALLQ